MLFAVVYMAPNGEYVSFSRLFTDEQSAQSLADRFAREATPTKYWKPEPFLATVEEEEGGGYELP